MAPGCPERASRREGEDSANFGIHLDVPAIIPAEEEQEVAYDLELDDVRSILRDVCASLEAVPGGRFTVTIGAPIPVSVRHDMVVVMEQLGDILERLRREGSAALDLYEQGIELQLAFSVTGDRISIERRDLLGRSAPCRAIESPRERAVQSLRSLAQTFVDAAKTRSSRRSAHPWFAGWARSLYDAAEM